MNKPASACVVCDAIFSASTRRRGKIYCFKCSLIMMKVRNIASMIARQSQPVHARYLKCVDCGKWAEHYEHRRYLKPTDVVPVCQSCNKKRGPALDVKEAAKAYLDSIQKLN